MNNHRTCLKSALLLGIASGCLLWQPALAQTAPKPTVAGWSVEEVVVTARKREENLQTVPLAVTVQTGEILQQHQITSAYSLQKLTPSLQAQSGNSSVGTPTFTIRGIGTNLSGPQIESSVGVVVDDVPLARIELGNYQFFDLQRVEVLRGPQGMLFGKNAAAGLINIVTNNPKLNATEFETRLTYGNTPSAESSGNNETVEFMGNAAVLPNAAVRVTGFYTHSDGFAKNINQPNQFMGMDQFGVRAKFLWEPTDAVRVLLAGDFTHEAGPAEAVQFPIQAAPGGIWQRMLAKDGITAGSDNLIVGGLGPQHNQQEIYGFSGKIDADLGGGYTLTNVAAFRARFQSSVLDNDMSSTTYFDNNGYSGHYAQQSEELRLTSPGYNRFSFQTGLFFQHLHATQQSGGPENFFWVNFAFDPTLLFSRPNLGGFPFSQHQCLCFEYDSRTVASFFEGQYKITDKLTLSAGARYTHDEMDYHAQVINFPDGEWTFYPPTNNSGNVGKYNASYRGSLNYQFTPDIMAYVSGARGYKGPTFDALNATPVGSEIPTTYEIGLKSTLLDNRLRLNLALFDETFRGFQTQVVSITGAITVNAGALKARGVEAEFTARPLEGLTISGGLTYNHTKYQNVPTLPCYSSQPSGPGNNQCSPGTFGAAFYPFGTTTVNGNQLAQAPKWTENLTLRYEHPVASGWTGFVQGDGYFRSSFNFAPYNDPGTEVRPTQIYGLSAGADRDDGRLSVSFFIRNLTDERVPNFLFRNGISVLTGDGGGARISAAGIAPYAGIGDIAAQYGPDSFRTIGIVIDYRM